jgi:hypothetical protein
MVMVPRVSAMEPGNLTGADAKGKLHAGAWICPSCHLMPPLFQPAMFLDSELLLMTPADRNAYELLERERMAREQLEAEEEAKRRTEDLCPGETIEQLKAADHILEEKDSIGE